MAFVPGLFLGFSNPNGEHLGLGTADTASDAEVLAIITPDLHSEYDCRSRRPPGDDKSDRTFGHSAWSPRSVR